MIVKVLGSGCARCKRLEGVVREVVEENKINADIVKVQNMNDIMQYDIMGTPALVIDEEVRSSGRIPAKEEILSWLSA